jgi:hypothetical protein
MYAATTPALIFGGGELLLKPHVTKLVVCDPRKNASMREGNKIDKIDARRLAELLRLNHLNPVYHGEHGLRTLKELSRRLTPRFVARRLQCGCRPFATKSLKERHSGSQFRRGRSTSYALANFFSIYTRLARTIRFAGFAQGFSYAKVASFFPLRLGSSVSVQRSGSFACRGVWSALFPVSCARRFSSKRRPNFRPILFNCVTRASQRDRAFCK